MFILWRKIVAFLRHLLLSVITKRPMDWHDEIEKVLDIAKEANDKLKPKTPVVPDYDLVGPMPQLGIRLRNWFKKLRKKQ